MRNIGLARLFASELMIFIGAYLVSGYVVASDKVFVISQAPLSTQADQRLVTIKCQITSALVRPSSVYWANLLSYVLISLILRIRVLNWGADIVLVAHRPCCFFDPNGSLLQVKIAGYIDAEQLQQVLGDVLKLAKIQDQATFSRDAR